MTINTELEIGHRPWGRYEVLSVKEGYKVKRIIVFPKGKLSLQLHQYRSEHWVCISGSGIMQLDNKQFEITQNDSVYIPIKSHHRITNTGLINLEIIETQIGKYLGEDDIVRLEDDFGRV